MSHILLVDTELIGYIIGNDGATIYPGPDYFFTDIVSTPPIQTRREIASQSDPFSRQESYYGATSGLITYLTAGIGSNITEIGTGNGGVSGWTEGMTGFTGITWAYDTDAFASVVSSNLTLTSISSTAPGQNPAPVPEPGALLLVGSGIAGVVVARKKFWNKRS